MRTLLVLLSFLPLLLCSSPGEQAVRERERKADKEHRDSRSSLSSNSSHGVSNNPKEIAGATTLHKTCQCPYSDDGASFDLAFPDEPVSYCSEGTQMLQCDGKIYGDGVEYDKLACLAGKWYGAGCDGTLTELSTTTPSVFCGKLEPDICPQLPSRDGLEYIGTENGLQRYTCAGDALAKLSFRRGNVLLGRSVLAKYIECNATYYRASSSNGDFWAFNDPIYAFSCRDYGKMDKTASVPYLVNAFIGFDGVIRCLKGFFAQTIRLIDASNNVITLASNVLPEAPTAKIAAGAWAVAGTSYTGVQLTSFQCVDSDLVRVGTCGALDISVNNVEFSPNYMQYSCWNQQNEEMEVITPTHTFFGTILKCVSGQWKFTGANTVDVPAGSKVTCKPYQTGVLPTLPPSLPLIPIANTAEGLTRWTCIDSTITLDIEYHPETGKRMPVHAAYLETNNTFYRFTSSGSGTVMANQGKIKSISCTDMGPKHSACSTPWDIGGIRRGNVYECMKGFYLTSASYFHEGNGNEVFAWRDTNDYDSLECTTAGWRFMGNGYSSLTPHTALRLVTFSCADVNPQSTGTPCASLNVRFANYKLHFNPNKKVFSCYPGEIMGYTLNRVKTMDSARKLYCGTDASGNAEWKWSYLDGTGEAAIPLGALISCY